MTDTFDPLAIARITETGGQPLLQRMIALFLEHAPRRMRDVEDAWNRGDLAALADAAHAIKSSSASMGAARVYDLSDQLEKAARDGANEAAAAVVPRLAAALETTCAETGTLIS